MECQLEIEKKKMKLQEGNFKDEKKGNKVGEKFFKLLEGPNLAYFSLLHLLSSHVSTATAYH